MVSNKEIVKCIFGESKIIKDSKYTNDFLKQILDADTKNFKLDTGVENGDLDVWADGIWEDGIWKDGYWINGTWVNGTWKNGYWKYGTWENGIWENGHWSNGIWENGIWREGIWIKGKWLKGKIWDFKKRIYIESNNPPDKCKWSSSYGK